MSLQCLLEPGQEGEDAVTLTCVADANPPATYRWLRKTSGKPLTEEPVYMLDPVDRTHIDIYSCIATNYLGSSQPGPVDVNVLYAPNMTVTASSTAPLVEGRDSVTLDCQVYCRHPRLSGILPSLMAHTYSRAKRSGITRNCW